MCLLKKRVDRLNLSITLIFSSFSSIDATAESGKLGRLVNHSRNGNLIPKTYLVNGRPHLVLIAKDDIPAGDELTYDYGDRSKEALKNHPWLAL
jgi:[histone H4]-lysine20 N-methyltransferase SETD8